jgi:hypothetical protein
MLTSDSSRASDDAINISVMCASITDIEADIEKVCSTARHAIHLQFDISANSLEMKELKVSGCTV